jgi:general stress protein YciG
MFRQIYKLHTKRNFHTTKPIFASTTSNKSTMSGNTNPGNFANRPKEEVQEIASKGGQASHSGGFASMDPDKQVSYLLR